MELSSGRSDLHKVLSIESLTRSNVQPGQMHITINKIKTSDSLKDGTGMISPIRLNSQNKSKQSQANFNMPIDDMPLEVNQTRKMLAVNSGSTGIGKIDPIMATRGTSNDISSLKGESLTSYERN